MFPWSDLFSGIIGAIIGAATSYWFQRRVELKRKQSSTRFEIYMMLLELKSILFWYISAELQKKGLPTQETRQRRRELAFKIADILRGHDSLPETPQILRILFSLSYETEQEREDDLAALLRKMGCLVNPHYQSCIRSIDVETSRLRESDPDLFMRRLERINPT